MMVSLCILFEILSIVFCLHCLYGEKPRPDKITILFIVIDVAWMTSINLLHMNSNWTWLIYPMIALYCGLRFRFNFREIFVNVILYLIIFCPIQATMMVLASVVFETVGVWVQLLINIEMFLIVALLLSRCGLHNISRILQHKENVIILAVAMICVSVLLFLLNYKQDNGFDIFYYIVLLASVFLLFFLIMDIGKHKVKAKEAEAELRLHKVYESSFHNLIDDIRAKQHEFDNHIGAVYSQHFLYHTYDELVEVQREYCEVIISENRYNKLLTKGNKIILGFLYGKFTEAEKAGICIDYHVNIGEFVCGVPVYKIIEILGNLINNAMEELQLHSSVNGLFVGLTEESERIQIEVRNQVIDIDYAAVQKFFVKNYSSKGENRGYGLANVKKICEDYEMELRCTYEKVEGSNWLCFVISKNKNA